MRRLPSHVSMLSSLLAAGLLAGCSLLELAPNGTAPVVADLEVFNRTLTDLHYLAADGERLDVPACGRARDTSFRIDQVQVRADSGYVRGFGAGGGEFAGRRLWLIERARAHESGIPSGDALPDRMPPCDQQAKVQPGA